MLIDVFKLSGRTALVTGGSKGLGKAMARGLAEAGADVMIVSRTEKELKAAVEEIKAGLQVQVDVGDDGPRAARDGELAGDEGSRHPDLQVDRIGSSGERWTSLLLHRRRQ